MSKEERNAREQYKNMFWGAVRHHMRNASKEQEKRKQVKPCLKCEFNNNGYCAKVSKWCYMARSECGLIPASSQPAPVRPVTAPRRKPKRSEDKTVEEKVSKAEQRRKRRTEAAVEYNRNIKDKTIY